MKPALYRIYNSDRLLIYVGMTADVHRRLQQHKNKSWWASQASEIIVIPQRSMREARQAELNSIRTENPRWNIGDRWWGLDTWTEASYADFIYSCFRVGGPNHPYIKRAQDSCVARYGAPAEIPSAPVAREVVSNFPTWTNPVVSTDALREMFEAKGPRAPRYDDDSGASGVFELNYEKVVRILRTADRPGTPLVRRTLAKQQPITTQFIVELLEVIKPMEFDDVFSDVEVAA